MIAPRRPLKPRLVRVRSRLLPAARGLRRRSPGAGSGSGWLPVGMRWRRVARPVSGAAAALPHRGAFHSPREERIGWRTRTLVLPAVRGDVPRGLPGLRGLRGASGMALPGEPGRRGATGYRAETRLMQIRAPSHRPSVQAAGPARRLPATAPAAPAEAVAVAVARLDWMRGVPGADGAPVQQRSPARDGRRADAARPAGRPIAGPPAPAQAKLRPAAALLQRSGLQPAHRAAATIDWRVRTGRAAQQAAAGAASAPALARRAELVWRAAPRALQSAAAAAAPATAPRRVAAAGYADTPGSAAPSPAPRLSAAPPAAPAMLDAAATERLVEDVLRRAEQRLRIERERRGL